MSLEAITRIRSVEEDMEQAKAEARSRAQKLAAEAERDGRAMLQKGKDDAAKTAAAELKKAEEEAAKRRTSILAQAKKDCESLKKQAGSRMDKATQAILGRVVGE